MVDLIRTLSITDIVDTDDNDLLRGILSLNKTTQSIKPPISDDYQPACVRRRNQLTRI